MRTFLDTNVLFAAFRGDADISTEAFKYIDDASLEFVVSDFLKIEVFPKAIFFKYQEELDFYTEYFNSASVFVSTTPDIINNAYNLACQYGLGGVDAILYQASVESNVAQFVTREKKSKPLHRIINPDIQVIYLP